MKIQSLLIAASLLACSLHAQPGHQGSTMFGGGIAKLFGDNSAFSAEMEMQVTVPPDQTMTMPEKITFDSGKVRIEMDLAKAEGSQMPPGAMEHMKAMGMDKTINISRPDTGTAYIIYPGLKAYAAMPLPDSEATKPASAFKIETTELGKETVDGHPCVKNKTVITDSQGNAHTYTVWNATRLKSFPIKIETSEQGHTMTMAFKKIKTTTPDADTFEPPADYKKYDSIQALMQQEMMKHMGNPPPGNP